MPRRPAAFDEPAAAGLDAICCGLTFVIAGTLKSVYDLALWQWFRRVPLPEQQEVSA